MLYKCIHMHIYEEFTIQRRIQAYKSDANLYGPLWTLTCICTMWTYFLIIHYLFPLLFFPKRLYHSPYHQQSHARLFPIITTSCMTSSPYILLSTQHSPVICKDNFPLVYMYKSSRYYLVFIINLGPMFPWSTIL